MKTDLTSQFESDRRKQLKKLYNQIIGNYPPTGQNKFYVYPIEASVGKTTTMVKALADLYLKKPDEKSLVITFLKKDAKEISDEINFKVGKNIAINIDAQNKKKTEPLIPTANVVVITHARYKTLCEKYPNIIKQRKYYCKSRKNLIIDEEIDLLVTWSFSVFDLYLLLEVLKKLNVPFYNVFSKAALKISNKLNSKRGTGSMEFWGDNVHSVYVQIFYMYLYDILKMKVSKNFFKHFYSSMGYNVNKRRFHSIVISLFHTLTNPYSILDSKGLHSYNDNVSAFMLENNIMLDASANMSKVYNAPCFKVIPMKRIINHSNWKICWWNEKSTSNYKENNPDFLKRVCDYIIKHIKSTDKVLIICKEGDKLDPKRESKWVRDYFAQKRVSQSNYSITNFKAMRGKNTWSEYNKCFIIHTPYEPYRNYVFRYLQWNPNKKLTNKDLCLRMQNKRYSFINQNNLEVFKESLIRSAFYQGVKRIDRNHNGKHVDVYIICNNQDTFKAVANELNGANIKRVKESAMQKKCRTYAKRPAKYAQAFISIIEKMLTNPSAIQQCYPKTYFKNQLGCKNFSREVMKNDDVKRYMKDKSIYEEKKHIFFH